MFTQPCFIRKNTPELRKKLEELGYKPNSYECFWDDNNRYIITTIGEDYGSYTLCIKNCCLLENEIFIDCGENEELFLALAALRDDSDYMQWFVNSIGDWYRCIDIIFNEENVNWALYTSGKNWHKATVEEIIEYFKDR